MWRSALQTLVAAGDYRTQADLMSALSERGFEVAQPTVSKALGALGVQKVDGVYRLPPSPEVGASVHSFAVTAAGCLAVVTTDPAHASVVAQFIDEAMPDGVLGTIAGDNTVFVATAGPAATEGLAALLGVVGSSEEA